MVAVAAESETSKQREWNSFAEGRKKESPLGWVWLYQRAAITRRMLDVELVSLQCGSSAMYLQTAMLTVVLSLLAVASAQRESHT